MEKLSKKVFASSCLFCVNSSTSVRKFKITEDYGGGNTIRYDLTSFLGNQIEPYLKDDDLLCSNCMSFFENMACTKRSLINFLKKRDESEDIKMQDFNDIWKGFTKFAVDLVKFNPNESEENWGANDVHSRSITPNPLVHAYSEPYNHAYEREFSELERARSKSGFWDANSETDLEIRQLFSRRGRRRKRGHNWSRRRGEQKSRALSRTYPAIYDSFERNCYTSMTTSSRTSVATAKTTETISRRRKKRKIVEGKPVKTRSVSRLENYLATVTAERESNKFYCEEINCSLFFEKLENLVLHKRHDHYIIARFPCKLCRFKGTTREELEMHHSRLHDKDIIMCFQCRTEIQGTYNLQEHLQRHLEYSIGCKFCYLSFLSKADLVEHVKEEHQGKKIKQVHEKPSFVCQKIVNEDKTPNYNVIFTNNNKKHIGKKKEYRSFVLNVEKSPSPEPVIQSTDLSRTINDESCVTVISDDSMIGNTIDLMSRSDSEVIRETDSELQESSNAPNRKSPTDVFQAEDDSEGTENMRDFNALEDNLQLSCLVPVVILKRMDFQKLNLNDYC